MAHASEKMITKGHWAVGIEWPVTLRDSGWDCNCIAWRKCKHIKAVESKFLGEDNATV